ncbi:MAG: (2E,6E)-farnesyl diphosphate synthase [Chromatiales bacterium]
MSYDQNFHEFLLFSQHRVENALSEYLPDENKVPTRLHQAMRYAALGPGKRIRPMLVYAAGQALGIKIDQLNAPACAVELIHAYSLVHDDLPAMDDDDLRRGRPTCHKQFDDATAILAGDALQALAFHVISKDNNGHFDAATKVRMLEQLAFASGSRGMCGGQAMDLVAVGQQLDLVQLELMHIHKTGALIRAAVKLGAFAAVNADEDHIRRLDHYAKCIGLAFQIHDDILDVEGDTEVLGKTRGKDAANDKPTYTSLLGVEGAREKAELLRQDAFEQLTVFDHCADPLRGLADFIVNRRH